MSDPVYPDIALHISNYYINRILVTENWTRASSREV